VPHRGNYNITIINKLTHVLELHPVEYLIDVNMIGQQGKYLVRICIWM